MWTLGASRLCPSPCLRVWACWTAMAQTAADRCLHGWWSLCPLKSCPPIFHRVPRRPYQNPSKKQIHSAPSRPVTVVNIVPSIYPSISLPVPLCPTGDRMRLTKRIPMSPSTHPSSCPPHVLASSPLHRSCVRPPIHPILKTSLGSSTDTPHRPLKSPPTSCPE